MFRGEIVNRAATTARHHEKKKKKVLNLRNSKYFPTHITTQKLPLSGLFHYTSYYNTRILLVQ